MHRHARRLFLLGVSSWFGCGAASGIQTTQSTVSQTGSSMKSGESDYKGNAGEVKDRAGNKGQSGGSSGGGGGSSGGFSSNGDPDSDGTRGEAKEAEANKAVTDEVGLKKLDLQDWRKYELAGRKGPIKVKLRWDTAAAELTVEVFDAFGENVASSIGKHREPKRELTTTIVEAGTYYTKVSAVQGGKTAAGSQYTMKLEWGGEPAKAAGGAGQVPPPVACAGPVCGPGQSPCGAAGQPACAPGAVTCCPPQPAAAPPAPAGPAYPVAGDPNHPRCRVAQSVREEDGTISLFLDRGSDAGIRVNMRGTLLKGKDGDEPADGGEFVVTKVIDKQKSVAKTSISSVGKNLRARIDLVPWRP